MKMFLKQKTNKEIVKQQNKKLLFKKKKTAQKEKNANALNAHISFESISNGIIRMKSKGKPIMCGVLAITGMDIYNLKEYERNAVFDNMARATMSLRANHKYIFTAACPYLQNQKNFIKYKAKQSINKYVSSLLDEQFYLLDSFEKNHRDRMAYLLIYDKSEKNIHDDAERYINQMVDVNVAWCTSDEIAAMLNSLLCLDTGAEKLSTPGTLNKKLLPEEIEFQSNYYKINNKYAQSIVIYDYAAEIDDLEYANIVTGYSDTIVWDIKERDKSTVLNEIQASLRELESRGAINQDRAEKIDTQTELAKLDLVYNNIKNGSEQIYYVTLRFIVSDNDLDRLQERTLDIVKELEQQGLSAYIPSNTMLQEFLSIIFDGNTIQTPFPVFDTLSRQFPFYYQSHIDPTGLFFGYTATGGLNILNTFTRTSERNSYDLLAIGVKGSGKSVTLKDMLEEQLLLGNRVLVLDIESEYRSMAEVYNGQVIKMNQRSRINPLQITKAVDSKVEEDILPEDDAKANFASELSRIRTFMSMYISDIDMFTLEAFMDLVTESLNEKGIYPDTDVRFLPPEKFPTFSDVMKKVKDKLYIEGNRERLTSKLIESYSNLEVYLRQLTGDGAYASMFDGATNVDISNNDLIIFDVKTISDMAENVYNAQLFNILTIMWSTVCKNVEHNQYLINPWDRRNVVCLIDEAHRFISVKYQQVTNFITNLVRRSRKYDAGLWFATQSILDFIPSNDSAAAEQIKVIFSLVQYKLILKQAPESIEMLHKIFPQFTDFELNASTSFMPGQMLLSLGSGRNKIHCRRMVSAKQLLYIGNSQDRIEIIHDCFAHYYNDHTNEEYGLMLRNADINYFRKCFMAETYAYLKLNQGDSQYLDNVIVLLIDNLIKELLSYTVGTDKEEQI